MKMKFGQLVVPFWVMLLLSCGSGQSQARWEPKIHVTVTNAFHDGRHISIMCQSYAKSVSEKSLVKSDMMYPKQVMGYAVENFNRDTEHKCLVNLDLEGRGKNVSYIFDAFCGSWNHDSVFLWDSKDNIIRYIWKLTESGLSVYSYLSEHFFLMKTWESIQVINVCIGNGFQLGSVTQTIIYVTCTSNQPNRDGARILSRSFLKGEYATWIVFEFNQETVQTCTVKFGVKRNPLQFKAFDGFWHHGDSIWDEKTKQRRYHWTVKDDGLFAYNYKIKEDELISPLPPKATV